ncbi:MAG TPA: DUF6510 family protein [Candidatus Dormibacteraeota bacterium]|nr:DUF6510 family protein [Candidatus Dormibacteraeota bacterium]
MTVKQAELKLDGNAIGGTLGEIFALEMTTAETTCAGCGKVNVMGRVAVYLNAPGVVLRCPDCENVLIKVVRGKGRCWMELAGVRRLEFDAPEG